MRAGAIPLRSAMIFEIWIGPKSATLRVVKDTNSDSMVEGEEFIKEFEADTYEEAKKEFYIVRAKHWGWDDSSN